MLSYIVRELHSGLFFYFLFTLAFENVLDLHVALGDVELYHM